MGEKEVRRAEAVAAPMNKLHEDATPKVAQCCRCHFWSCFAGRSRYPQSQGRAIPRVTKHFVRHSLQFWRGSGIQREVN